ncbi:MAG: molybdenum cofactor guanylyltransferase [Synergistaceae bacterium]|jgi:molybdopterin-guanine dinucleotide biosynthesis protein A|nr:molybdenum cofactor guanylyltransferase [Synergistaceae bacterium]
MSAVVLAGGKSRRMGTDKALLRWREKNFLETILRTLSIFRNLFISTADGDRYASIPCVKVPDLLPGVGPIGGIYTSLMASWDEYLFVTACDTPLLSVDLVASLCRAAEGYPCCVAAESDGRLHPLCGVYHRSMIPILREQAENGQYKITLACERVRTRYFTLSPEQAAELRNFNTRDDYLEMIAPARAAGYAERRRIAE